ncbi:MAG: hypothetical protein ACOH2N_07980 [Devosia sp.]
MALSPSIMGILGSAVLLLSMAPNAAQAQPAYGQRDAEYVSNSKNVDVLSYIVCLEDQAARQPRRLDIAAALDNAVIECRSDAARLPHGHSEAGASDITASILECGFRPEKGSSKTRKIARSGGPNFGAGQMTKGLCSRLDEVGGSRQAKSSINNS